MDIKESTSGNDQFVVHLGSYLERLRKTIKPSGRLAYIKAQIRA